MILIYSVSAIFCYLAVQNGENTENRPILEKQKLNFLTSLLPVRIASVVLLRSPSIVCISPPIVPPT